MSKLWFYQFMGSTIGPIPSAELKARVQKGQISADTLVRLGDDGKWQQADRIKGLLDPPVASVTRPSVPSKPDAKSSDKVPVTASAPAAKAKPSFDHERTYHLQGDDQPHEDIGTDSGEFDFFRFVGFEQAIGPKLHQVFIEYCHRNQLSLTQATRKAIADFVGRKDLASDEPAASTDTDAEIKVSDTSIEIAKPSR
jgi:hypothetical protein